MGEPTLESLLDAISRVEASAREAQAQKLACYWQVGGNYEWQGFWISAFDILAGDHTLEINTFLDPESMVAIRPAEPGMRGIIMFGSESKRDRFVSRMAGGR